jgi:hypothetical protein
MKPDSTQAMGANLDAPRRPGASATTRSLAPREHGAYGQLGMPLVAALAMGRPGVGAVALAFAGVAVFLGHEPVLVAIGQRGARARREEGARARRRILALGAAAAVVGCVGVALAPAPARVALLVPVALGGVLAGFIARKAEKTTTGELLAAAALSSAAIPVALSCGVSASAAWGAWAAWCASFGASTFAVRTVIAHARSPVSPPGRLVAPVAVGATLALAVFLGGLPLFAALAAAPMIAVALGLAAAPPPPRLLKKVGWMLVASSVLLSAVLAVGARA